MTEIKLKVNMHCASCATIIDKAISKIGAQSVSNAALKITKVKYEEDKITKSDILNAISKTGYEAKEQ